MPHIVKLQAALFDLGLQLALPLKHLGRGELFGDHVFLVVGVGMIIMVLLMDAKNEAKEIKNG